MNPFQFREGNASYFSLDHGQLYRVIEDQTLWGETIYRVGLPDHDSVARLKSMESAGTGSSDTIACVAAVARVVDALTQDVLLTPIESSFIPLPNYIRAFSQDIGSLNTGHLAGGMKYWRSLHHKCRGGRLWRIRIRLILEERILEGIRDRGFEFDPFRRLHSISLGLCGFGAPHIDSFREINEASTVDDRFTMKINNYYPILEAG